MHLHPASFLTVAIGALLSTAGVPSVPASADVAGADRAKIEAALPAKPVVAPRKTRRLLIFDRNVNYGGHPSAATANVAFTRMGEKTGAFQAVVSGDPAVFEPASLRRFDAVFFNNNVGNLFAEPELRQSLVDFIYAGGGMMGVHGTTVAFTKWPGATEDWPEFGLMIGGRGANHKASNELVVARLDDPAHPLNQPFLSGGLSCRDEFFRVHEPYSRSRLRILFSIDTEKTDMNQGPSRGALLRPDNDYALAWVRNYGRGRSFYCTIAHNPSVFWDAKMLQFYLGAAQFVLGDLEAPTTPSLSLTPAVAAQEKLGWRVGLGCTSASLFEEIDQAARLGLNFLGASSQQRLRPDSPQAVDIQLTSADLQLLRFKLDQSGVRLLTFTIAQPLGEATACRSWFQLARKLGVEAVIPNRAAPGVIAELEQLAFEFGLKIAWPPGEGGTGVCADLTSTTDPASILKQCEKRLVIAQLSAGEPVKAAAALREMQRCALKPVMIALTGDATEVEKTLAAVNETGLQLAGAKNSK